MKVIQCDECGSICAEHNFFIRVEASVHIAGEPSELEFCSWKCVHDYAKERSG
ncbi:hypothetical protein P9597_02425 [Aneurinibacillus migulanus]|uniref:hypothetical protein n=1 Tax=Aneurinibacillus migulanus TaxID=47500 RepID=UPI002E1B88D0|nr:hypothetical protein [Aneurinibacillus migulanus]